VIGVGSFGKNHVRVIHNSPHAGLSGVFDANPARAAEVAGAVGARVFSSLEELASSSDAAVVATPTTTHAAVGCRMMELGLDVLVEKPIAESLESANALMQSAAKHSRILAVGHLERFNPAIIALESVVTTPLFFEVHRLSEFSPRSLDVDVVLDLMIHDLDILLAFTGKKPEEIRAAGISILSKKVDIANVRLQFPGGCVANVTASRVSTERVRKLRLFQPDEYISLDYSRQDGARFRVKPPMGIDFSPLAVQKDEPLRLELEDFFESVSTRRAPRVTGQAATEALEVALGILAKIEEHAAVVEKTLASS
jgi:predicted dehydrogenase